MVLGFYFPDELISGLNKATHFLTDNQSINKQYIPCKEKSLVWPIGLQLAEIDVVAFQTV
jgi:hypothetical protein